MLDDCRYQVCRPYLLFSFWCAKRNGLVSIMECLKCYGANKEYLKGER